jgi:hypothetical protein
MHSIMYSARLKTVTSRCDPLLAVYTNVNYYVVRQACMHARIQRCQARAHRALAIASNGIL